MENHSIVNVSLHLMLDDIKNPLTSICLAAESLKRKNIDAEEKEKLLSIIENNCKTIQHYSEEMCKMLESTPVIS